MSGTLDPNTLRFLLRRTAAGESGNRDNAQNPFSTASGRYQITDGLWSGLRKNYPDAGLNNKNDPQQQAKAYSLFANREVLPTFGKSGFNPQVGDYDAAWTFGAPRALQMRKAGDGATIDSVLGADTRNIIKQNPHYFPQGIKTPVGTVRQAISQAYDKAAGATNDPDYDTLGIPPTQNGGDMSGTLGMGRLMLNPNQQIPDAPETPQTNVVQNSPWMNALNYLAAWGGGGSLSGGAAAGAQWLGQHQAQLQQQDKMNEERATTDWENKLKTATLRNQQMNANSDQGKTAAELLRNGWSAPNIVTLLNGQGGEIDPNGMPQPGEGRQGTPKGFMDAKYWKLPQEDGSEHNVLISVNKDTGQPEAQDVDTGQTLSGNQLAGVYDPNAPAEVDRAKASNKAEDDFGNSVANGVGTLNSVQTIKSLLPTIKDATGPQIAPTLARTILNATGIPLGSSDADSLALATKALNGLRIDYLNSARSPGMRTDIPMVKTMFGAVPDLTSATPAALKTFLDETENMQNYKQNLWGAWETAPDTVKRRGFNAFRNSYQTNKDTAYKPLDYQKTLEENRKLYSTPSPSSSAVSQPSAGSVPSPRVGSGQAPVITGGWKRVN